MSSDRNYRPNYQTAQYKYTSDRPQHPFRYPGGSFSRTDQQNQYQVPQTSYDNEFQLRGSVSQIRTDHSNSNRHEKIGDGGRPTFFDGSYSSKDSNFGYNPLRYSQLSCTEAELYDQQFSFQSTNDELYVGSTSSQITSFENSDYIDAKGNRTFDSMNNLNRQDESASQKDQDVFGNNSQNCALPVKKNIREVFKKYCELCKVFCEGQASYEAHLVGSRHKMQEARKQKNSSDPNRSGHLRCPLCDRYFPNAFTYCTHIRGSKHKQVMKNLKLLGKIIPECNLKAARREKLARIKAVGEEFIEKMQNPPVGSKHLVCTLCNCSFDEGAVEKHCKGKPHKKKYSARLATLAVNEGIGKPEIHRVENICNSNLKDDEAITDSESSDIDDTLPQKEKEYNEDNLEQSPNVQTNREGNSKEESDPIQQKGIMCEVCKINCPDEYSYSTHLRGGRHRKELLYQKKFHGMPLNKHEVKAAKAQALANIPLVGEEYIVEPGNLRPKLLYCKLCECELGKAERDKHLRGKRHRLSYKKKVDSTLLVESMHERGVSWGQFLQEKRQFLQEKE